MANSAEDPRPEAKPPQAKNNAKKLARRSFFDRTVTKSAGRLTINLTYGEWTQEPTGFPTT
jgi:hypothetical protein